MIDWIQVNMSCSFLFWTYLTIPTLSHAVGIQIPRFRVRERLRKGFAQRRRSCCQVDEWIILPDQCPMFKLQPNSFIIFNILYTLIIFYEFVNFFPFQPRLSSPFPGCVWQVRSLTKSHPLPRSRSARRARTPNQRLQEMTRWHHPTNTFRNQRMFTRTHAIVCWMPKRNAWKYCLCLHEYYFIFPYTL